MRARREALDHAETHGPHWLQPFANDTELILWQADYPRTSGAPLCRCGCRVAFLQSNDKMRSAQEGQPSGRRHDFRTSCHGDGARTVVRSEIFSRQSW